MLPVLPLQTNLSINNSSSYTKSTVLSSVPELDAPKQAVAAAASRTTSKSRVPSLFRTSKQTAAAAVLDSMNQKPCQVVK